MKTAKNTNRIVMNQYLTPSPVFSRIESPLILSALLVGLLILTACGGAAAIPTTFVNPNTSNSNGSGDGSGNGSGNSQQPDTDTEPEPDRVRGSDWATSFSSPLASMDSTNPRNQFLPILDQGKFSYRSSAVIRIFGASYQGVQFDGLNLGSRSRQKEGASFGQASLTVGSGRSERTETHYYASVLTDTNVGAPLPVFEAGNPISANWNGGFRTKLDYRIYIESPINFALTVNFRDSTIEAFVKDVYTEIDNYYHLNGSYDTGGIITGTVNYGTFSDIDARTPTNNRPNNGVLTGIIGQDFAIGGFVSGTSTDDGVTITGGTGDDGFSGGFIVSSTATYDPNITNNDWLRSFATPLSRTPNQITPRNQFVKFVSHDQQFRGLTGLGYFDGQFTERGQSVHYNRAQIGETLYYHANIGFASSDLPLPAYETGNPISANWNGNFSAVNGAGAVIGGAVPRTDGSLFFYTIGTDFALTVNFRDSTIEAFVKENDDTSNYYHIKGNYANIAERNVDGIITGTVNFGTFSDIDARTPTNNRPANGVLTGLIGQRYAVGAFVSGTSTDGGATITGGTGPNGFAGGFWATPTATYDPNVRTTDWRRSFASPLSLQPETTSPRNQFVEGIASATNQKLESPAITFDGVGQLSGLTVTNFATRLINGTRYYYATLPATRFNFQPNFVSAGLPLPVFETGNPISADWNGHINALHGATGEFDTDFAITVNFRDSTIEAFVKQGTTSNYYHIEGNYANNTAKNADGIITGTVNYGTFSDVDARTPTNNRANNGVLTGIIGQNNLQAVFVSGTTTDGGVTITGGTGDDGFAGGFWASPTADYIANHADWTRYLFTPLPVTDTTSRRNQFVNSLTTFGLTDADSDSIGGVSFGAGAVDGTQYYYASISNTANMGAVLPEFQTGNTASARWNGQFHAYEGATGEVETDFMLEVNFQNSSLFAFVRPTGGRGDYNMNATYGENGVINGTITRGSNQGHVTGLIGQNGAIGAFVSGTSTNRGVTITGGTGANGFVGGFTATPPSE